jgi:hypothetical protein
MTRKAYSSEPLPIGFKPSLYQEGVNDGVYYQDQNGEKEDNLISLYKYMSAVKGEKSSVVKPSSSGGTMTIYPSKRFSIPYGNKQKIIENELIPEKYKKYFLYTGLKDMKFTISGNTMTKDQVMTLEMLSEIAKGDWERPIYFASIRHAHKLGLHQYLINEGMAYRLIPFDQGKYWNEEANIEKMYFNLVENEKIKWTNLHDKSIHYSDQYANFVSQSRNKFSVLAKALYADTTIADRKDKALNAIEKCLDIMPNGPFYFERSHIQMAMILSGFDQNEMAISLVDTIVKQCEQEKIYRSQNRGKSQYGHNYYVANVMIDDCISFYNSVGELEKASALSSLK